MDKNNYVIEVENVNKYFKVYNDKGYTLKEKLLFWHRNTSEVKRVLNDVSFKVKKGESLGLIGENGAGKSTTLKLLSKIIYPNTGNIKIRGRVACLIELGAGFHPDMTGRENIYTNASIFGLTKKEIDERIDAIIEFSELGECVDDPVRTYSSGMYMRLAFSVAINVEADILLIDEILAVGDIAFQKKCFDKLKDIKKSGTTIVIVSHSTSQIEEICDKTIWFKNNEMFKYDKSKVVTTYYKEYMAAKSSLLQNNVEYGNDIIKDINYSSERYQWDKNERQLQIKISYKTNLTKESYYVKISVYRNDGLYCCGIIIPVSAIKNDADDNYIDFVLGNISLLTGDFLVDLFFYDNEDVLIKYISSIASFNISPERNSVIKFDGVVKFTAKFN